MITTINMIITSINDITIDVHDTYSNNSSIDIHIIVISAAEVVSPLVGALATGQRAPTRASKGAAPSAADVSLSL